MKKVILLSLAFVFTCQLFGQKLTISNKWKVKKWGVALGNDLDMLRGIDYTYFLNSADGNTDRYQGMEFSPQDLYSAICENPNLRVELTLLPPGMKNTELNIGIAAMINRVDGAHYRTNDWGNTPKQYLAFNSYTNELALEGTLRKRWNVLRVLNLYGGVGTNLGMSVGGQVRVSGSNVPVDDNGNVIRGIGTDGGSTSEGATTMMEYFDDTFDMKNALHQRVFLHGGLGIICFRRIEIALEGRYGIGYRYFGGDAINTTQLNSLGLTARYIMR